MRWHERPTSQQLLRLRRHYAANMTLIDEQIALILEALAKKGYLENAIVLFTSDHGDCLGDQGRIQKLTMYDCIVRTPTLVWAPRRLPAGKRAGELVQQFDLVPLLLELAGLQPPAGLAVSALAVARGEHPRREVVFAEQSADNVYQGVNLLTMVRTCAGSSSTTWTSPGASRTISRTTPMKCETSGPSPRCRPFGRICWPS